MSLNNEIRRAIDSLPPRAARQILKLIMLQVDMAGQHDEAKSHLFESLKELQRELLAAHTQVQSPITDAATVHLVFGDSTAGSLRVAIKQMGHADTDKTITFRDLFSIGPLWHLHKENGRQHRRQWLLDHINDGSGETDPEDEEAEFQKPAEQLANIPPQASIVIWSGGNAHEQTGLRYAAYLLRDRPNALYTFDAGSACAGKYNREDYSVDYLHTGEIIPEKLQAVFGEWLEGGPVSGDTRRVLEREWMTLAESREVLRIWSDNRIVSVGAHYFDAYLLETVEKLHGYKANHDFIKALRVIGEAIGHCEQFIGDGYFEYRLRELVYNGKLEIKGVPKAMRYYSVKRKW